MEEVQKIVTRLEKSKGRSFAALMMTWRHGPGMT